MRRSPLPSLVVGLITMLAAAIAPLLVVSPAHAGDDPDVGRPEVGSCHNLTYQQVGQPADPKDPVDCSRRHTTITSAVRDRPKGLGWNSDELVDWSVTACERAMIKSFGARHTEQLARSAYELAFFYPTQAQRNRGADWVRCDIVLHGDVKLMPLSRHLGFDFSTKLCLAPKPRDFAHTVCSRRHSYESIGAVKSGLRTYPSRRYWLRLGQRCAGRTDYFIWPGKAVYRGGGVYVTCFIQSS